MIAQVISLTSVHRRRVPSVAIAMVIATAMAGCKTTSSGTMRPAPTRWPQGRKMDRKAALMKHGGSRLGRALSCQSERPVAAINHANILRAGGQRATGRRRSWSRPRSTIPRAWTYLAPTAGRSPTSATSIRRFERALIAHIYRIGPDWVSCPCRVLFSTRWAPRRGAALLRNRVADRPR